MSRHFPALRGLAIFLVVINHSITLGMQFARVEGVVLPQWQKYILVAIKEFGIFAVPLFLFLAASYFAYAAQGKDFQGMVRLVPNTVKFILIPYILWSVLFYVVAFYLFGEKTDLVGYTKNLIIGYPNNFVPLLLFFTILAPLLVWLSRKSQTLIFLLFLAYQAFLVIILRPDLFGKVFPDWTNTLALPVIRLPLALWGIFYPLGIIYGLNSEKSRKLLNPLSLISLFITLCLFVISVSTQLGFTNFPIVEIIAPFFGVLWLTTLKREQIPFIHWFERLGKRSYGLYLINLILINLLLTAIIAIGSKNILIYQPVIVFLVAAITLLLPLYWMEAIEKRSGRSFYKMIFG